MMQDKHKIPITILICDDDEDDRMLTRQALEDAHIANRLRFVEDGEQLLDYLYQRGEYAGAVDSFVACVKTRKDWVEALVNLGVASWKFEDLETAAATFRQVLTINPKHAEALRSLAAVTIQQKNSREARELVDKLAALGAPSPELSYNLGLLLQSTGDFNAAAECYQATLQHKPGFAGALINLGHALKSAGKEDEARHAWNQAVAANPELAGKCFQ